MASNTEKIDPLSELGIEESKVEPLTLSKESLDESVEGDEALQLVGSERKDVFDDAYNAKLRRKLDLYIPSICAAVYFTQYLDKNTLSYARFAFQMGPF